jgi:hypothetical protein
MTRKMVPHGTWHGICSEVRQIWYSRDEELEEQVFDALPDWMQPVEENKYTEDRDNKIICDFLKLRLSQREVEIIDSRFGSELIFKDIGNEHDLSSARVLQIYENALRKMRWQTFRTPQVLLWMERINRWSETLEASDRKKILGGEKYAAYFKREAERKERERKEREEYYKWVRQLELAQEKIEEEKRKNKRAKFLSDLDSFDDIILRELRSMAADKQDLVVLEKIAIILYCRKVQKIYADFEQKA